MKDQTSEIRAQRIVVENLVVALAYWGVSQANFIIFSNAGVLPMPIWPAAALAFVVAFYRGWRVAPGIVVGTVLANHFSLGAPWVFACSIAVMNTFGPLIGANLMRRRVSRELTIGGAGDLAICFLLAVILTPMLTATGGVGFKWLLGLMPGSAVPIAWLKWALAHSTGTLLFATPVFAWLKGRPSQ